jgi:hypothetical protein
MTINLHTHIYIKRKLNSGNAYYHSVQKLLSSRLLSKNIKIRIYKTIILLVAWAWSTNGGEEKCIGDIGGKARRKETTRKTKA